MDQGTLTDFQAQIAHASDDRRKVAISAAIACLVLIWLIVPLRFVARWYSAMRYGWDDWMIVLGLVSSTALVIDTALSSVFGGGQHTVLLISDPDKLVAYLKGSLANKILLMPTLMAIKLSILILYGRLFPIKTFHLILWGIGTLIGLYTLASTVVCLVQCTPLSSLWEFFAPGTCLNVSAALTTLGALNITTNVVILALPIPLVWRLHTTRTVKIQITAMFLTGAFDTVISIVRTYYISRISSWDPTWTETNPIAWTAAEVAAAIICACLPTYRPLFDKSVRKSARNVKEISNTSQSKSVTVAESPSGLEERPSSRIWVQTTIENTWDEHYGISICPNAEDIWTNELVPASRTLSRSHSRGKLDSSSPTSIWRGLSRSTSLRKLEVKGENEKECS